MIFRKHFTIILFSIFISVLPLSILAQANSLSPIENTEIEDSLHIDVFYYKITKMQLIPDRKLLRGQIEIKASSNKSLDSLEISLDEAFKIVKHSYNDSIVSLDRNKDLIYLKPENGILKDRPFKVILSYYCTESNSSLWESSLDGDNFYFSNRNTSSLFPTIGDQRERATIEIETIIPDDYRIVSFNEAVKTSRKNAYIVKSTERFPLDNFSFNMVKDFSKFDYKSHRVKLHQFTPIDSTLIFKDLLNQVPEQISFLDSIIGNYPYKDFRILIKRKGEKFGLHYSHKLTTLPYDYVLDSVLSDKVILTGLCHQWFGNRTSPESVNDIWITEGLSRYIEWLWLERKYGKIAFSKMISAKKVELDKYAGFIDWKSINPYPMYTYDIHTAPIDFNIIPKSTIKSEEDLKFLLHVLSIEPDKLNDSLKLDFRNTFGRSIDDPFEEVLNYHDVIIWARKQESETFRLSLDAYYTLAALGINEFETNNITLSNPGVVDSSLKLNILRDKAALFFHYIRIYYGDDLFFEFFNNFIAIVSDDSIDSETVRRLILSDSEPELEEIMNMWIYSNEQIPFFKTKEQS